MQRRRGRATNTHLHWSSTVTCTQKSRLRKDRLHLATRRILARIKSALQKSRKQKTLPVEEKEATRQPKLSSPDRTKKWEIRGRRELNEERRKRVEFSGVVT